MKDMDIESFFANLTPEQFVNNTAFFERPVPPLALFDNFISEHMQVLRIAYASCDGNIFPIGTLGTADKVFYFKATDEESLGEFAGRLSDFAATHQARWLFIFKKVRVMVDENDPEPTLAVYWLAGERTDSGVDYQQGYFHVDGQVLGECVVSDSDTQPDGFRMILEGRPT